MIRLAAISSSRGDDVDPAEREHQPLQLRHVERRRRALAGDVGDQHAEAVIVEREEVVVVAADLARRHAERRSPTARACRAAPAAAATSGSRGRCAAPPRAASSRRSSRSRSSMLAVIELNDSRQLAELIARADGDLVGEVALAHALGAGEQLVHRAGDRSRQRQPGHQRDDLDDQEQHADDQQHEQQALAESARLRPGGRDPPVDLADAQLHRGDDGAAARLAGRPVRDLRETDRHDRAAPPSNRRRPRP